MTRKKNKSPTPGARPTKAVVLGAPGSATERLSEDTALLALAAPAVAAPSAKVRARLLARIRASQALTAQAPSVPPGWRFESASVAEGWRETFPGVRFKTLSVDDARDVVMLLVEMKPGSRFPDHLHDVSADEGVVISGDVDMDGHLMGPGDYYYAGLGTVHKNVTSPSGCIAMLSLKASAWRLWRRQLTTP